MKDKPIIPDKSELRKRNEDIFYESAEPKPTNASITSIRDGIPKQPALQESESKFLMVADDEFFDAEEPTSCEHGEDPELLSSDEVEGSCMDEEEPELCNYVRFASLKRFYVDWSLNYYAKSIDFFSVYFRAPTRVNENYTNAWTIEFMLTFMFLAMILYLIFEHCIVFSGYWRPFLTIICWCRLPKTLFQRLQQLLNDFRTLLQVP